MSQFHHRPGRAADDPAIEFVIQGRERPARERFRGTISLLLADPIGPEGLNIDLHLGGKRDAVSIVILPDKRFANLRVLITDWRYTANTHVAEIVLPHQLDPDQLEDEPPEPKQHLRVRRPREA